ncbi:MAG: DUF7453 family protein [Planctomycetota bacterium]|jgi:hypothetical protein
MHAAPECLALAIAIATTPALAGGTVSFTLIANGSTPIPDAGEQFGFVFDPAYDAGEACFWGRNPSFDQGIYAMTGDQLRVIADTSTSIPGGFGTFDTFGGDPMLHGGDIVLVGWGPANQMGIYTPGVLDGTVLVFADRNMSVPQGTGNFTFTGWPSVYGGVLTFLGFGGGQTGIYRVASPGSAATVVVDKGTTIPQGNLTFTAFEGPSHNKGQVAFRGTGPFDQRGIYLKTGDDLQLIANRSTSIPQGIGSFTDFGTIPSLSDGTMAFVGQGAAGQIGVYRYDGSLHRIADRTTMIPEGTGGFTSFHNFVSNSGGRVAFIGEGTGGQRGLYVDDHGTLRKLIDQDDSLDGQAIQSISSIDRDALDGNRIAFTVVFENGGGFGAYIATFASPADLDADGDVDIDDLLLVLLGFGPCPAGPDECPADINDDGLVGVDDLLAVILGWTAP